MNPDKMKMGVSEGTLSGFMAGRNCGKSQFQLIEEQSKKETDEKIAELHEILIRQMNGY